jgi:predicted DNA binding CopG/RHH family protein
VKPKLDPEELEILEAFESGARNPLPDAKALMKQHRDAAVATFQKDSRIDTRISSKDLRSMQKPPGAKA